ncbi:hypothetical protein MKX08_004100 [Trichoderma sp. CBMAI-0020]|nr:hypothetical protein MKX08_004100 [Trichoderma sp. CBMAI-0020]
MASHTANRTPSWHNLPVEIRQTILNALLHTGGSLAAYAAVSREWQDVVEPHNFSHLQLTMPRIEQLDLMTFRTQKHVQYIWLCLELEEYGLRESRLQGMSIADSHAIGRALHEVVDTLSSWSTRPSLVLDISVHSPSDSAYWFKYLTFEPDHPFNQRERGYSELPELSMPTIANDDGNDSDDSDYSDYSDDSDYISDDSDDSDDSDRSQSQGSDDEVFITDRAIGKVFDLIQVKGPFATNQEEHEWWMGMPLAPAVTAVLLRQQTRRRWPTETLLRLLSRFPRLREIHYEPWREWQDDAQKTTDGNYKTFFQLVAPTRLKKLAVFENFHQRCLKLEQISASFIIDAKQFFEARGRDWKWASLTTLILTSRLLEPLGNQPNITTMFLRAARTALRMPKLELMEIWNGRRGVAAVFRYQTSRYKANSEAKQRPTMMTWRGTWMFRLEVPLIQAWEYVTYKLHGNVFLIKRELLSGRLIESHADAIHRLELAQSVIRPVSQRQIRAEHMAVEDVFLVPPS